jgi:type II secretory pathway pseudopilin PulG
MTMCTTALTAHGPRLSALGFRLFVGTESRKPKAERRTRSSEHGVSLVEATIMLTVIATLASALAPTMTDYIAAARQARAREDVQVIGNAIQDFIRDNAEIKFLRTAKGAASNGQPPANRLDANRVDLLVSDGDVGVLGPGVAGETYWTQATNNAAVDSLSNHLVENLPGSAAANRYRNPSDIFVAAPGGNNIDFARSDSSGFNGPYSWRGPYLRGPVDPDPWGFRYMVNVAFLDPNPQGAVANVTAGWVLGDYPRLDVFVLSQGSDREVDTRSAQDGAVPGDDDIIYIVSSNAL